MRTQVDALLSVRRWVRSVLPGPPWRVLLAADQGRVERPYAVVTTADGAAGSPDVSGVVRMVLPVVAHAFPPAGSRASASKLIAERVAEALEAAVRVGVPDYKDATVRGGQQRIPLWDYGGGRTLTLEELVNEDALEVASVKRKPRDYLMVSEGWKAQALPQVDTMDLFVATFEARVAWYAPTTRPVTGPTLQAVNVEVTAH